MKDGWIDSKEDGKLDWIRLQDVGRKIGIISIHALNYMKSRD